MASNATQSIDAGVDAGIVHAAEPLQDELVSKLPVLEEMAADLWAADYGSLFANEIERNRALVSHHAGTFCCTSSQLQLSSYARRLSGHRREEWERRQLIRERDQLAIALHAANMRAWSHSLVARSIAYFTLTTSWLHQVESGQARLASCPTSVQPLSWSSGGCGTAAPSQSGNKGPM